MYEEHTLFSHRRYDIWSSYLMLTNEHDEQALEGQYFSLFEEKEAG